MSERLKKTNIFTSDKAKRILLFAIPAIVLIFVLSIIIKSASTPSNASQGADIQKPQATTQINKNFTFSLKDAAGKQVSSFTYTILNAELDKQIIIKGTPATAIDGRIFLVINLKLVNSQNQGMQVNTRDYVRLSVNGSKSEYLAPEIHNDPVEVQALSTKFTRIGFPINTTDKKYVLRVGEIDSTKKDIPLILK